MKKVFFCIGAQKAGTTSLHNILSNHSEVDLPKIKETKFFLKDDLYEKGIEYYRNRFFISKNCAKIQGEIDPEYMFFDEVAKRILKEYGSNVKFIVMLRNPIKRAYSHFLMSKSRGFEKKTFEEALHVEKSRLKKGFFYVNNFSYIKRGLYSEQIMNYLRYFPVENFKFVLFEDFIDNQYKVIRDICLFLDVNPLDPQLCIIKSNRASQPKSKLFRDFWFQSKNLRNMGRILVPSKSLRVKIFDNINKINQRQSSYPSIPPELYNHLVDYFSEDILKTESIIKHDLSDWLLKDRL